MSRIPESPLASGFAPSWAWGWGQDEFGAFAEIRVGQVVQRLRWIYAGSFLMGSPESEDGRYDREGPRHRVELTEGFWLADTQCTQAFWQEVMGDNPSRFKSPDRPVEQVTWDQVQEFMQKLEQRLPGFEGRLPTEAQWEYECRAGTQTATWLGDLEILGENNAPLLDEIAWYGGNSGVDFELEDGWDSSDWPNKQYPHQKAGTRKVKTRVPNPWGLYDMLGNVWEWCSDHWTRPQGYTGEDRQDPEGTDGPSRVYRGGSWYALAQYVRAAYRLGYEPGDRYHDLGFRLSRGPQVSRRPG